MDRVISICYRFTNSLEEAQDLAQEVFIKIYRNLDKFEGRSNLGTWIYRIAYNQCVDYSRKKKVKVLPLKEDSPDENSARDEIDKRQFFHKVKEYLHKLPPKQRLAFMMRHFDGMSIGEISRILRISNSSVKTHLKRAILNLRKELRDYV